jgi:hypothetical protein
MHSEHEAVEPAANAKKADAVTRLQELTLFGEGGGQRQ